MSEYRVLPYSGGTPRQISEVVNNAMAGKINCTGSITLDQSTTSTTLHDSRLAHETVILLMPTNARAAEEIGHGHVYVSDRNVGSATITHGSHSYDMTFDFALIG